jgi:cysteinyl-tRNA synthetase
MALKIYNTLSRQIEEFIPQNKEEVKLYTCGPTVYDFTHIGHMRKYVGDDTIKRTLFFLGYNVKHVMNITDVGHLSSDADLGEDKIEKGAQKYGKTVWEIANFYTEDFINTMQDMYVSAPNFVEKATDHIPSIITLIEKLQKNGHVYETESAVYFDISTFRDYGKLSGQKLSEKEVGARADVVVDNDKKNPQDFVLWFKRVGKFADHIMHWPSPWGDGFPGWHIECSAISMEYLGNTLDIHTGGIDHIPVHHENEIAQSESATGVQFVKYWVHHEFLQVNGEKMSKSKENFYTLKDIREHGMNPRALRLLFLQTNYRKPLNFTWESLEGATNTLRKLDRWIQDNNAEEGTISEMYMDKFTSALEDDFNTAKALAVMFDLIGDTSVPTPDKITTIRKFNFVFALQLFEQKASSIPPEVADLLSKRTQARENKDWARSDELRDQILKLGYEVKDTDSGTIIKRI